MTRAERVLSLVEQYGLGDFALGDRVEDIRTGRVGIVKRITKRPGGPEDQQEKILVLWSDGTDTELDWWRLRKIELIGVKA